MLFNHQVVAAALCHVGAFHFGFLTGWLSPALPQLNSASKPVGEVTLEQTSLMAALPSFVGVMAPLVLFFSNRYGRRKCMIASAVPFAINGIMILLARDIYVLLVGRFIAGLGVIFYICNSSIFVSEFASANIRGRLASFYILEFTFGVFSAYCIGGFISYRAAAAVMVFIGVFNFFSLMFIPDSPIFLLKRGKVKEAVKSLVWFQQVSESSPMILSEISNLEISISSEKTSMESLKLLFMSRPLSYGFIICLVIFFGQVNTGMFAVQGYTVTIFLEGGLTAFSPEQASMIFSCIQICGALSTTTLVERAGRKALLLCSFSGLALSMAIMGLYFNLKDQNIGVEKHPWIPIVTLCFCVYIHTAGAGGVPFILLSDMLPPEVRVIATILVMQITSFSYSVLMKCFEPMAVTFGWHVMFYYFSVCCAMTVLFVTFFFSETKGKSNQDILDKNYGFKATLKFNEKN